MNQNLYTPLEAAEILKIKKNTVYEMIKRGTLKATKMGKQIRITESDLNALIHSVSSSDSIASAPSNLLSPEPYYNPTDNIIVCGQDMVLDLLCSSVNLQLGTSKFIRSYDGSYNGLLSLYRDEVTVASVHIWDRTTDTYNTPFIASLIPGEKIRLYHVLNRPIGFYVAKGNPKQIHSITDLNRPDVQIVNREKGSGVRILMDSLLLDNEINPGEISGYNRIVNSHLAAAAMVSKGGADCAIGNKNVALQFSDIEFIYLKTEQYDIAIKESDMTRPEITAMITVLESASFQEQISSMGLYDITDMGKRIM